MNFVLIPGAGGQAAYWSRLVPELERRGHLATPVDIREDDPRLGLPEYAAAVDAAIAAADGSGAGGRAGAGGGAGAADGSRAGGGDGIVLVAQSLGGFTAPMVRTPARMIVLLNAMIPQPGETPGAWWGNTGSEAPGGDPDFDAEHYFLHDIPDDVKAEMLAGESRAPSDTPFGQPCDFERWPDVPIRVLTGRDDRFFPAEFQRRVAKERLGLDADLIPGGHLVALANPGGLAARLAEYAAELER
jgi:pimeloyl-ACP methyl ester carboxylesterase